MLSRLAANHTPFGEFVRRIVARFKPPSEHIIADKETTTDKKVLEDVFEAFLGAMFLDMGFDVVSAWLVGFIEKYVDFAEVIINNRSAKHDLNTLLPPKYGYIPTFQTVSENSNANNARHYYDHPGHLRCHPRYGAFAKPEESVMYTVDIQPVHKIAPNHVVLRKDARHIESYDVGDSPLDLVFFDCHDYDVQMAVYDRLVAKGYTWSCFENPRLLIVLCGLMEMKSMMETSVTFGGE
eukprot:gene32334-biopygen4420